MKRPLIILAGFVLAVAVTLQLLPKTNEPFLAAPEKLESLVPGSVAGWTMEKRELGDTEQMRETVQSILGFEQAFFRVYRRGSTEVGVYVAYWTAEQNTHPMDAATHSPDLCWINAGWTEQRHDYAYRMDDGKGRPLKIAQFREFTAGPARQEVVFWHLMGGRLSGYALGPSRRWEARLPVLWENMRENRFGFVRREQYFIRISTNRSITELAADPLWAEIMSGLATTGLWE